MGLKGMCMGERRQITMPPSLAFGDRKKFPQVIERRKKNRGKGREKKIFY